MKWFKSLIIGAVLVVTFLITKSMFFKHGDTIRVAVFQVDATPPLGSPVAYAQTRSITDSLSARGIVILSDQMPIVLCAVDWIGIANGGLDAWKKQLADAAGTTVDRVFVHSLHQHDAPRCDFTTEEIIAEYGLVNRRFDRPFALKAIASTSFALKQAMVTAVEVTDIGFGKAEVNQVASNRRILGDDGKVKLMRFSRSTDPEAQAAPEGLIDPWLKSVSFWNGDSALAVLTFYATHPQSFYGEGDVTSEFVGIARNNRQTALNGIPHLHFTGAAGNIAAGKYNDGSTEMRPILTHRMELAMEQAWNNTKKEAIGTDDLLWKCLSVKLPLAPYMNEKSLRAILSDTNATAGSRANAANKLAFLSQMEKSSGLDISVLEIGSVSILNLPGEPFVEYQLAAQAMAKNKNVCTAGYGEYGVGYIGTAVSYEQGGYETSEGASTVSPEAEGVLLNAIKDLMK